MGTMPVEITILSWAYHGDFLWGGAIALKNCFNTHSLGSSLFHPNLLLYKLKFVIPFLSSL